MQRQSETRWSARDKAVRTVNCHLDKLLKLLEDLTENGITADIRSGAHALFQSMQFLTLLTFWNNTLSSISRVQKRLQDPQMTFKEAATDLNRLQEHIHDSHENICDHAIEKEKELCVAWGLSVTRKQIRRKKQNDEAASHTELSYEQEIRRVMKATVDRLVTEVNGRFSRLRDLESRFGFLLQVDNTVFASMEDDE